MKNCDGRTSLPVRLPVQDQQSALSMVDAADAVLSARKQEQMGKKEIEPVDDAVHYVVRTDEKGRKVKMTVSSAVSAIAGSDAGREVLARHILRGSLSTDFAEFRPAAAEDRLDRLPTVAFEPVYRNWALDTAEGVERRIVEILRTETASEHEKKKSVMEAAAPTPELTPKEIAVRLFTGIQEQNTDHSAKWLAGAAGVEYSEIIPAILDKLAAAGKITRTVINGGKVRYSK